jgi:glycine C-acetyltransferase
MYNSIKLHLKNELDQIESNGLFKRERIISSSQQAEITLNTGEKVFLL